MSFSQIFQNKNGLGKDFLKNKARKASKAPTFHPPYGKGSIHLAMRKAKEG